MMVDMSDCSPWWYAECSATDPASCATLISRLSLRFRMVNSTCEQTSSTWNAVEWWLLGLSVIDSLSCISSLNEQAISSNLGIARTSLLVSDCYSNQTLEWIWKKISDIIFGAKSRSSLLKGKSINLFHGNHFKFKEQHVFNGLLVSKTNHFQYKSYLKTSQF